MHPICFYIGSRPIYWYGVMVATAFLTAVLNWHLIARREHRPPGFATDMAFWIMLAGILGARAAYVLANLDYYLAEPGKVLRIDLGGLIYYGGFIGGILAVIAFARFNKLRMWSMGDYAITSIPLAHAIGRIGCFLNGCCYGTPTDLPCAVVFDEVARHPTQLYEAAGNLAVFGLLTWFYFRRKREGTVLALYLMTYPILRFLLEFLRGDERLRIAGLSLAQHLSIGLFVFGVVLWFVLPQKEPVRDFSDADKNRKA